jgi:hypothetical protein
MRREGKFYSFRGWDYLPPALIINREFDVLRYEGEAEYQTQNDQKFGLAYFTVERQSTQIPGTATFLNK